jgi:hypothetical protein
MMFVKERMNRGWTINGPLQPACSVQRLRRERNDGEEGEYERSKCGGPGRGLLGWRGGRSDKKIPSERERERKKRV